MAITHLERLVLIILVTHCSTLQSDPTQNDPELLQQLWNQLYRYLPGTSMAPQLPAGPTGRIQVSAMIDTVDVRHVDNGLLCRASFSLISEWPATDERITESRLVGLISNGVRLDLRRVWHPELVVIGSYRFQRLSQRLELRMGTSSTSDMKIATMQAQVRSPIDPLSTSEREMSDQRGVPSTVSGYGMAENLRFVLIENYVVELPCFHGTGFGQLSTVLCSIWIRQEGSTQSQPSIKWADERQCPLSAGAKSQISNLNLAEIPVSNVDRQGTNRMLSINICFPQTAKMLYCAILPTVLTCASLVWLWFYSQEPCTSVRCQIILTLLSAGLWPWLTEKLPNQNGFPGLVDTWCLICFIVILLATGLTLLNEGWFGRVCGWKTRHTRYPITLQDKHTDRTVDEASSNPIRSLSPEGFRPCPFACPEFSASAFNMHSKAIERPVTSPNNLNACCANGACRAAESRGYFAAHVRNASDEAGYCTGLTNVKTDRHGECCVSNGKCCALKGEFADMTTHSAHNGGPVCHSDTSATEWKNYSHPTTDCQIWPCHLGTTWPMNIQPAVTACGRTNNFKRSYCSKVAKLVLTVSFIVISAVFWITVLSQGTVPQICRGKSFCSFESPDYVF